MAAGSYVDLRKAASKKAPDNNFAGVSLSLRGTGVTLITASISNFHVLRLTTRKQRLQPGNVALSPQSLAFFETPNLRRK